MICYKDMTFCSSSDKCKPLEKCDRQYTSEHKARAIKVGLPIAMRDFSNECGRFNPVAPPSGE